MNSSGLERNASDMISFGSRTSIRASSQNLEDEGQSAESGLVRRLEDQSVANFVANFVANTVNCNLGT